MRTEEASEGKAACRALLAQAGARGHKAVGGAARPDLSQDAGTECDSAVIPGGDLDRDRNTTPAEAANPFGLRGMARCSRVRGRLFPM